MKDFMFTMYVYDIYGSVELNEILMLFVLCKVLFYYYYFTLVSLGWFHDCEMCIIILVTVFAFALAGVKKSSMQDTLKLVSSLFNVLKQ